MSCWPISPGFASAARRKCCSRRPTKPISPISWQTFPLTCRSSSSASARTCWCATAACPASSFAWAEASRRRTMEPGHRLRIGAAVPDMQAARAAAKAGLSGLSFYRGIPGSIGGALRMNAGAHGAETKDTLIEARGVDRTGAHPHFLAGRHAHDLSAFGRARRRDLHQRALSGHAVPRPRRSSARWPR